MTDTTLTAAAPALATGTAPLQASPGQGQFNASVTQSIVDDWWVWLLGSGGLILIAVVAVLVLRRAARNRAPERNAAELRPATAGRAPREWDARQAEDALLKEREAFRRGLGERIEQGLNAKGEKVPELSLDLKDAIGADFIALFPVEPLSDLVRARREEFVNDWVAALTPAPRPAEGQARSALTAALAPITRVQAARNARNRKRQDDQLQQVQAAQQALLAQANDGSSTLALQEQQQALAELQFQIATIDPTAPGSAARLDATQRQLDQLTAKGATQSQARGARLQADLVQPIANGREVREEEEKVYQEPPRDARRGEPTEPSRERPTRIE